MIQGECLLLGSGALQLDDMLGNIFKERFRRRVLDWTFVNCNSSYGYGPRRLAYNMCDSLLQVWPLGKCDLNPFHDSERKDGELMEDQDMISRFCATIRPIRPCALKIHVHYVYNIRGPASSRCRMILHCTYVQRDRVASSSRIKDQRWQCAASKYSPRQRLPNACISYKRPLWHNR